LSLENGSELRKKLRKRLEAGIKRTKEAISSSWSERKAGEENAGTHRKTRLKLL